MCFSRFPLYYYLLLWSKKLFEITVETVKENAETSEEYWGSQCAHYVAFMGAHYLKKKKKKPNYFFSVAWFGKLSKWAEIC